VSYTLDRATDSIRYTTTRLVEQDEELCIYYGHKLWFKPVEATARNPIVPDPGESAAEDVWGGMSALAADDLSSGDEQANPWAAGDQRELVDEDAVPFDRIRTTPDELTEEDAASVQTGTPLPLQTCPIPPPESVSQWTRGQSTCPTHDTSRRCSGGSRARSTIPPHSVTSSAFARPADARPSSSPPSSAPFPSQTPLPR
jgi:hypothetical protein